MIDIKIPPVILDLFVSIPLYHTFFCPSNLGRRQSISNEITMLNNQIYDMVREEIEKRTDSAVIEQKCAELYEKIQSLKDEIKSIHAEKQMADAGSGKLREIYAALENMNTEFTEYDDAVVRRLVSKVRVMSKDKVIVTLCGSLDIEQEL